MEQELSSQESQANTSVYLWVLPLGIGLAIGAGVGIPIGSIGAGIGMGLAAGVAVGVTLYRRFKSRSRDG